MRVAIYSPAYSKSAGTRYKVDMMKRALSPSHEVILVKEEQESLFRRIYHQTGSSLLNHKWTWNRIGGYISNLIIQYKPDYAVLVTDVSASAIPFLKSKGVKTILSIEDLTPEWLNFKGKKFYELLKSSAAECNGVITVSQLMKDKLENIGIQSEVVSHGLTKIYMTLGEARERRRFPCIILNAGQFELEKEVDAFKTASKILLKKHKMMAYSSGRFAKKLAADLPGINWYNFSSLEEAVQALKKCSIGLVIRYKGQIPTRLFFHASMLQPVIALGEGWIDEVSKHPIGIVTSPDRVLEAADEILDHYEKYLLAINEYANANFIEQAYAPLIKMIT